MQTGNPVSINSGECADRIAAALAETRDQVHLERDLFVPTASCRSREFD